MKSFKHEHLFYLHSYMSSQHTLSLQLQTDLGLRYRTFSRKLISWLHFLKSLKRAMLKDCVIRSDEFTY